MTRESTADRTTTEGESASPDRAVRVAVDGTTYAGRALNLSNVGTPADPDLDPTAGDERGDDGRDDAERSDDGRGGDGHDDERGLDPEAVGRAVRGGAGPVDVDCPEPEPVHEYVGVVRPGMGLSTRTALAAAARSRGLAAPHDEAVASVREELAGLSVPDAGAEAGVSPAAARRRLAGTEREVERLRERVATLRGRVQAAREAGHDPDEVQAELTEAARALSEAETERAAAREALDRAEERAREARDARERRRRLQDRAANLERAARAHLVDRLEDEFERALDALPAEGGRSRPAEPAPSRPDSPDRDPFDADPVAAALAVARVADLRAPVVLACDRFETPEAAADWLDAPVVRV